jgi:hypothetical protein
MQIDIDWISGLVFGIESGVAYEMDDDGNIPPDGAASATITISLGVFRIEIYLDGEGGGTPLKEKQA